MSEKKMLRAWGRGCAWSLALRLIVAAALLIFMVGCIALTIFLPVDEDMRIFIFAGGFLIFMFVVVAGIVAWGVWGYRQRANQFDECFTPLGLTGRLYLTNGRQYHGSAGGRQVDAYFYRGPVLDIYVAANLRTRLGIAAKSGLGKLASNLLKRPSMEIGDPDFAHLNLHPLDERWARDLLAEPRAKAIVLRLMSEASDIEIRQLLFQPEAIQLKLYHARVGNITPENVSAWVAGLSELARLAESLPAPMQTAEASSLERKTRLDRSSYTWPIVGITCGVMAVITVCVLVISFGLIYLTEGGF